MPIQYPIRDLPEELTHEDAVQAVYGDDVRWAEDKLRQGLSVLFECDKQLLPFIYAEIRSRLREERDGRRLECRFVSGRPARRPREQAREGGGREAAAAGAGGAREEEREMSAGLLTMMVRELGEVVRASEPGTVVVVPHIDLL